MAQDEKRDGAESAGANSVRPDVDAAGAWVKGDDLNARLARCRGAGRAERRTPGYSLSQAPSHAPAMARAAEMEGGGQECRTVAARDPAEPAGSRG